MMLVAVIEQIENKLSRKNQFFALVFKETPEATGMWLVKNIPQLRSVEKREE